MFASNSVIHSHTFFFNCHESFWTQSVLLSYSSFSLSIFPSLLTLYAPNLLFFHPSSIYSYHLIHAFFSFLDHQTISEREADIKHLQEQLIEAKQNNEAHEATQANQNQNPPSIQATDANIAGDANQVLQEEVAKLRQEVLYFKSWHHKIIFHPTFIHLYLSIDNHTSLLITCIL